MDIKRELEIMKEVEQANKKHLEDWKRGQMQRFYFTFGSDPEYPYGPDDYVMIQCSSGAEACMFFDARFPKRPGSTCMNCAFMYSEESWEKSCKQYYLDENGIVRDPAESIILTVGQK